MGAQGLTPYDEVYGRSPCIVDLPSITEMILALPPSIYLQFCYVVLPQP